MAEQHRGEHEAEDEARRYDCDSLKGMQRTLC